MTESGRMTMGLMEKVRAQATVLAEKAQDTARDRKAKFDQAQAKRRGDVLLRNLGAAVYAERTGRGGPSTISGVITRPPGSVMLSPCCSFPYSGPRGIPSSWAFSRLNMPGLAFS